MTKREAATAACKVLAITFFIMRAPTVITQIVLGGPPVLFNVASAIAVVLVPLALWLLSDRLSRAMISTDGPLTQDPSHARTEWYSLAVMVLGFIVLFRAIPDLSYMVTYASRQLFPNVYGANDQWYVLHNFWITAPIYIIVGLWLILGSRGLVEMLKKKSQPVS
jgi:hypothetical protein